MAGTNKFDILFQFHQTAIQDFQHRLLNASPLTTLWVKSPLTRRIEQPIPPLEVKACWNSPDVKVNDGSIELSADLNGGARQILSGRILTLDGTVSARQAVTAMVDSQQRPYVCLKIPKPAQVDLRQLKASYEGSRWPKLLAKIDPAKEITTLRPVLATELFGQLACIPLTCMPYSLPVGMPNNKGGATAGNLPIKRMVPSLFAAPASVTLGLMLDDRRKAPATFSSLLPTQSPYNAAIAFSEDGLNMLLTHQCDQNEAKGQMQHTSLGRIEWHWEKLSVALRQDGLAISGLLVQHGARIAIAAVVKSMLVNNGCLQSSIVSGHLDANATETLLVAWNTTLKLLLRSRAANKQNQDARDTERLFQCFDLPTSNHTIEAIAQELAVSEGLFIVYYTVPKSVKEFPFEFAPLKPMVTITQPQIPQQIAPRAPVTIELDAQITKDSTPPYDYAWTNDLSPNPVPQFSQKYTLSSVPLKPAIGDGSQTLTTVHLKVIDMFGQVTEAQASAKYMPATKQQKIHVGAKTTGLLTTLIFLAFLLIRVIALAAFHHGSPAHISVLQQTSGVYMTFSGAINGTMSVPQPAVCGVSSLDSTNYEIQASGTINGISYLLLIQIIPYSGRGTYTTSDSNHFIALQPHGYLIGWGSNGQPFKVITTGDGRSGSVSASMTNGDSQVQVSGNWTCP